MPPLPSLLADLAIIPPGGAHPPAVDIQAVTDDSRRCAPGTLFVAIEGTQADGHSFLPQAAAGGAAAAIVARDVPSPPPGLPLIRVENTRRVLALIAQRLAGDPSHAMLVVAVTGTKGKTTVAYLMEAIFAAAGMTPGVFGTVNYRWPGHVEAAPNTTPSPTELADSLRRMREDGVKAVAMEISSHAIEQHRADGIRLAAAAMTNLSHEHLDYHKTMAEYGRAKERLFTELLPANPDGIAVLNMDDETARGFVKSAGTRRVLTFSLDPRRSNAHVWAREVAVEPAGMRLELNALGRRLTLRTPMLGTFNAANCLTAAALGLAVGIAPEAVAAGIAAMPGAPGRFEFVNAGQPFRVIVDYAHTPDSLRQLLENAREITPGRLIAVFGCGGDRDNTKRAPMGRHAAQLADEIIVTNDNPRTEDPERIFEMISEGVRDGLRGGPSGKRPWHKQLDRRAAIEHALSLAREGDTVVIAGKGHEDYQILGKEKIHFDDREVAMEILSGMPSEQNS
jgi:UDP-N-acetylmuramoyl-L-alanyl-D-glutamate--2,6-diaminopimelate ligase